MYEVSPASGTCSIYCDCGEMFAHTFILSRSWTINFVWNEIVHNCSLRTMNCTDMQVQWYFHVRPFQPFIRTERIAFSVEPPPLIGSSISDQNIRMRSESLGHNPSNGQPYPSTSLMLIWWTRTQPSSVGRIYVALRMLNGWLLVLANVNCNSHVHPGRMMNWITLWVHVSVASKWRTCQIMLHSQRHIRPSAARNRRSTEVSFIPLREIVVTLDYITILSNHSRS